MVIAVSQWVPPASRPSLPPKTTPVAASYGASASSCQRRGLDTAPPPAGATAFDESRLSSRDSWNLRATRPSWNIVRRSVRGPDWVDMSRFLDPSPTIILEHVGAVDSIKGWLLWAMFAVLFSAWNHTQAIATAGSVGIRFCCLVRKAWLTNSCSHPLAKHRWQPWHWRSRCWLLPVFWSLADWNCLWLCLYHKPAVYITQSTSFWLICLNYWFSYNGISFILTYYVVIIRFPVLSCWFPWGKSQLAMQQCYNGFSQILVLDVSCQKIINSTKHVISEQFGSSSRFKQNHMQPHKNYIKPCKQKKLTIKHNKSHVKPYETIELPLYLMVNLQQCTMASRSCRGDKLVKARQAGLPETPHEVQLLHLGG